LALNVWLGKDRTGARDANGRPREAYEFFDVMDMDDDEWTRLIFLSLISYEWMADGFIG